MNPPRISSNNKTVCVAPTILTPIQLIKKNTKSIDSDITTDPR